MLLWIAVAHAAPLGVADVPNPRDSGAWVADVAGVIPAEAEARMNARIERLHADLGAEIAVVTAPDVEGEPKAFATTLLNEWGVGSEAANNGVVLLLVVERRRVEIEVGYGLEAVLTDAAAGRLLDTNVVPRFKAGDLGGGLEAGVDALDTRLRGSPEESRVGTDGAVGGPARARDQAATGRSSEPVSGLTLLAGAGGGSLLLGGGAWLYLQRRRRRCEVCGKEMLLLDEVADDAHLDAGQQAEERLGSVDYEVRLCEEHERVVVIPHNKWFSGYSACSSCGRRTARKQSVTVEHATYTHGGRVRVTEDCQHCGHHDVHHYSTPRLQRSTSTGSSRGGRSGGGGSFGGRSGGGSFGGGRSGGGGAGRSW